MLMVGLFAAASPLEVNYEVVGKVLESSCKCLLSFQVMLKLCVFVLNTCALSFALDMCAPSY
jgi:hypothetical protein